MYGFSYYNGKKLCQHHIRNLASLSPLEPRQTADLWIYPYPNSFQYHRGKGHRIILIEHDELAIFLGLLRNTKASCMTVQSTVAVALNPQSWTGYVSFAIDFPLSSIHFFIWTIFPSFNTCLFLSNHFSEVHH